MTSQELDRCIRNYMSGKTEYFDLIYHETSKNVYFSIRSIFDDKEIIKDLMQDTYIKVINSLDSYDLGSSFKAWISRIARNIALNEYQRRKKEVVVDDPVLDSSEESKYLNEAYSVLNSQEDKEIFTYHIVLGMGFRDISEVTNIPKSTVHNIYKRIVSTLKKHLGDENNEIQ